MNLKKHIEKTFGRGSYKHWKHSDFEELSCEILQSTKILISSKTLKRYFGKEKTRKNYKPQADTLKALMLYANMPNDSDQPKLNKKHGFYFGLLLIAVVLVLGLVWPKHGKKTETHIELLKTEGHTPTTAYFKYSISTTTDSLFVDFGDKSKWQYLSPTDSICSHLYVFPDVFEVTIRSRSQVVGNTTKVFCKTKGWKAIGFSKHDRQKTYPIPLAKSINNGCFAPSTTVLKESGINTQAFFMTGLFNYQDFAVQSGQFRLETRLKSEILRTEDICSGVVVWLNFENGKIKQHLNSIGCSYWLHCIYGNCVLSGSRADISQFSVELSQWFNLSLESHPDVLLIYIDNTLVHKQPMAISMGALKGIYFHFVGKGYVDYCTIKTLAGKTIFTENFEKN